MIISSLCIINIKGINSVNVRSSYKVRIKAESIQNEVSIISFYFIGHK